MVEPPVPVVEPPVPVAEPPVPVVEPPLPLTPPVVPLLPALPVFAVVPEPLLQAAAKSAKDKVAIRVVGAVFKDNPPLVPESGR